MARHAALALVLLTCGGCGAKTGLDDAPVDAGPTACEVLCPGSTFCEPSCQVEGGCEPLPPPDCDDDDPCTTDRCDPTLDRCVHEVVLRDDDDDGFFAPLECGGDDCDDTDPLVHPGAPERCNGLDDNCNGLVDEGADLVPAGVETVFAGSPVTDNAASVAWTGESWAVGYWDYRDGDADVFVARLDALGSPIGVEVEVTTSAGDGFGPAMAWTGRELGVAWSDRRDGNFEVYFARFDGELRRLTGDLRLTDDPAWSVYPRVAWSGREYLVVWQDDRSGAFEVLARRVGPGGPVAEAEILRPSLDGLEAESPEVAFDGERYHFAWLEGRLGHFDVVHQSRDELLASPSRQVLSPGAVGTASSPALAAGAGVVAVAWERSFGGLFEIHVAVVEGSGALVAPARPLATDTLLAREPALLAVSSGFLVVWSGSSGSRFDLFFSVLDPAGVPVLEAAPLSAAPGDAVGASLALGPGDVGVVWSDRRSGDYDAYFTRLLCAGL